MPQWKCKACGNTVEAPRKPEQCPCGSEEIEEVEDKGILEKLKQSFGF